MTPRETPTEKLEANPGYAAFQIARLLVSASEHEDDGKRERALEKLEKWKSVLEGMLSGHLAIGDRQPIADFPIWATPEIVTGGFATGKLLADGEFQNHEIELARRVGTTRSRLSLNAWYLTEEGLAELVDHLRSGSYEVQVPEEAALLVVAWLAVNDKPNEARELLDAFLPYCPFLRFYPTPGGRHAACGTRVFLESVGTVIQRLRAMRPHPGILAQREAIQIWTPLYRKMITTFLETIDGEVPTIRPDAGGRWNSPKTKRFYVVGGWPCRNYPADWCERAKLLLVSIEAARSAYQLCGKPRNPDKSFAKLQELLKKCSANPASLSGADVGMVRLILARHIASHGTPGSQKAADIEARQDAQIARPLHHDLASAVIARLSKHPADAGLDDVSEVLGPTAGTVSSIAKIAEGTAVPPSIVRKVERCLCETVEVLVERGVVTSGDTLARVVPQFVASLRAASFDDPWLRTLYAATYRAFRRRRSVLLLNFENQVRIEELPWVTAMERYRRSDVATQELARGTLKEVAALTLSAFPYAILPNKLLQEFHALAKGAQLELPFVEELAADIFMGGFSQKFTDAAKQAAAYVQGTLYARYFGIDCAEVLLLPEGKASPQRRRLFRIMPSTKSFADLCIQRTGTQKDQSWGVARNGMIIEQAQILTTHNLSLVFGLLGLESDLREQLRDMAERCFRWICHRQQVKSNHLHAKLIMLKQTAYAWRQMIFYISRLSHSEVSEFLQWANQHLSEQSEDFNARFSSILRGLAQAHEKGELDSKLPRFLGWTQGRHFLLATKKEPQL